MSDRNDPLRWAEGGAGAPEAFDVLLRADENASESDAARLARVVDGVARELARPELALAYRARRSADAEAGRHAEPGVAPESAGAPAAAAPHGAMIVKVAGALLALATAAALWRFGATGAGAGAAAPPRERPSAPPAAAPAVAPPQPNEQEVIAPSAEMPQSRTTPGAPRGSAARATAMVDPTTELALLEAAQRALRSDPRQALALAARHGRRFARGQLEQEREMLAIEALLRLDREADARVRARRFERRFPASSHLPRLHRLLPPRAAGPAL